MTFLKTVDGVSFELVPATEKAEIEKAAHRIKEFMVYIHRMMEYSDCAKTCPILKKLVSKA